MSVGSDLPTTIGAAIVGAQKSGTTTLASLLSEHPQICLAIDKEAHLFDQASVQRRGPTAEEIAERWPHRSPGQVLLDATPSYLYLPGCVEALLRHSPDARLIVVLRSPGERAVSHHGHERRLGNEQRNFLTALALERRRLMRSRDPLAPNSAQRHASYCDRGRYAHQIARLQRQTDRVHVLTLRELSTAPERVMAEVYEFLGLPPHPVSEIPRLNAGDGAPSRVSTALARRLMRRDAIETEHLLGLPPGSLQ